MKHLLSLVFIIIIFSGCEGAYKPKPDYSNRIRLIQFKNGVYNSETVSKMLSLFVEPELKSAYFDSIYADLKGDTLYLYKREYDSVYFNVHTYGAVEISYIDTVTYTKQ